MTDTFSSHLPENCPPSDANEAFESVYHVVKKDPLEEADFRTAHEADLFLDGDACQRCSVSIFTDLADVTKMLDYLPYMKKRLLAKGYITPEGGPIKRTPNQTPSHCSWWPNKGDKRSRYFQVIGKMREFE